MRWFEPVPESTKSKLPRYWFLFATLLIVSASFAGWVFWAKSGGKPVEEGFRVGFYNSIFGLLLLLLIRKMNFLGAREISFGKKGLWITNTTPSVRIVYEEMRNFSFDQFTDSGCSFDRLTISTKDGRHESILIPNKVSPARINEFLTQKTNGA